MESVDDALPSWLGLRPRLGGELELVVLVDTHAPLADGHALLLHLVARALQQGKRRDVTGFHPPFCSLDHSFAALERVVCYNPAAGHRVCCLAASPIPQAHCAAVLRKLGVDRAQVEEAFAYLPLFSPVPGSASTVDAMAAVHRAMDFFSRSPARALTTAATACGGRVLVLDDASLAAGILGQSAAVELVQACRRALLLLQEENEAEAGAAADAADASSLLVGTMDDTGGGSSKPILPLLLRHADALVEVRPLASGYSRDVHGLVSSTRGQPASCFRLLDAF